MSESRKAIVQITAKLAAAMGRKHMVTTGRFPEMNWKRGLSQPDPERPVGLRFEMSDPPTKADARI